MEGRKFGNFISEKESSLLKNVRFSLLKKKKAVGKLVFFVIWAGIIPRKDFLQLLKMTKHLGKFVYREPKPQQPAERGTA